MATKAIERFLPAEKMSEEQREGFNVAMQEMENKLQVTLIDAQTSMERNISDRHKADMASDSWLSKNVRPLGLVYLTVMFTMMAFGSVYFQFDMEYVKMLKQLLLAVYGFYYGSRGLEKITKVLKG